VIDATLITIHGFWSSPATWERLTEVWGADEELRGLRIHPFGYSSPKKPRLPFSVTRVPDYNDIAQTLATEYATVLAGASDMAIVTHSQGGLILQRFLAWMVSEGRARELSRIRSVVMLACPNGGSEYLESLRRTLGYGRHPQAGSLQVLDRQVADTQRTVLQRIVNPAAIDDHQCRIPFHVYAGGSDEIVKAASAQAAFPGASTIAGNHFTILDPAAPGNRTAEIVKHHMLADIAAAHVQPSAVPAPEIAGEPAPPAADKRAGGGKYVVNAEGVQGLQIGDHNEQHNVFPASSPGD
jgi:pimeloyl-ACP methyl ester carboxylesterase